MLSSAGASPDAFGAGIGRGLASIGAALEVHEQRKKQRVEQTDRFTTLTNFSAFETNVSERLTELKRNADPSGKGFQQLAEAEYGKAEAEFLARDVTPELREEFTYRASQVKQRIVGEALTFEYAAGDAYFRTGIDKEYQSALKGLNPDTGGSPEQLDAWKARVFETIDTSDLSEIEKEELKLKTSIGMEGVGYKQAYKRAQAAGAINIPDSVGSVIDAAAERNGVDAKALRVVAWLESRGNPSAQNPRSSAGGLFQQIDSNAREWGVANRFDAGQSAEGAARFMASNKRYLESKLGRPVSAGELYLAHQQGPGSALKLLSNPNRQATEVVGFDAVRLNGGAPGMTAGQFAQLWISKAEGADPNLDNNPAFANLPYEDRLAIRADGDREVAAEAADAIAANKLAIDTQVNDLLNGIMDGTRGQADIDAGYQDGWLGDYDTRKRAQDALDKKTEDTRFLATAVTKLDSEYSVWDPTSDDDKKMLNAIVGDSGLQKLASADQDYVTNGVVPLVQRTNDIPTDVVGTLTGMVRSNNQTQAMFALDTLRQLQEADPRAYDARISDALAADVEFYRQRKDIYPADELMRMVNGGNSTEERQARTIKRKEAQEILAAREGGVSALSTLVGEAVGEFGGLISSPNLVAVPAFAKQFDFDYQTMFVDAYEKTGEKDLAHDMAVEGMKRNWGVTAVGGRNTLMKHPPEKVGYRPLAGDYGWIDKQLRTELGLAEGQSFELISDDKTKQEYQRWQAGEGSPASYQVVTYDEYGTPRLRLDAAGRPERRYFAPTEEDKASEVKAFDQRRAKLALDEFNRMHEGAVLLEIQQGIPVPDELKEEKIRLEEELKAVTPPKAPPLIIDPATLPDTPGMARKRAIEGMH
jgi:soluble lytic murein transglycosylase-like protein